MHCVQSVLPADDVCEGINAEWNCHYEEDDHYHCQYFKDKEYPVVNAGTADEVHKLMLEAIKAVDKEHEAHHRKASVEQLRAARVAREQGQPGKPGSSSKDQGEQLETKQDMQQAQPHKASTSTARGGPASVTPAAKTKKAPSSVDSKESLTADAKSGKDCAKGSLRRVRSIFDTFEL